MFKDMYDTEMEDIQQGMNRLKRIVNEKMQRIIQI